VLCARPRPVFPTAPFFRSRFLRSPSHGSMYEHLCPWSRCRGIRFLLSSDGLQHYSCLRTMAARQDCSRTMRYIAWLDVVRSGCCWRISSDIKNIRARFASGTFIYGSIVARRKHDASATVLFSTSDGKIGCCPTAGQKRVEYPPTRRNGQPQSLGSPRSFRGRLLASECVFHAVRDTGASKEKLAHSKSVTSLEARVRQ